MGTARPRGAATLAAEEACLEFGRTRQEFSSASGSSVSKARDLLGQKGQEKFEETKLTCCNPSARVANAGLQGTGVIEEALQVVNAQQMHCPSHLHGDDMPLRLYISPGLKIQYIIYS